MEHLAAEKPSAWPGDQSRTQQVQPYEVRTCRRCVYSYFLFLQANQVIQLQVNLTLDAIGASYRYLKCCLPLSAVGQLTAFLQRLFCAELRQTFRHQTVASELLL